MGSIAFIFPGQGSQYPGMGSELHRDFPVARKVFEEAAAALDFDLLDLCFDGPAEKLTLTEYAQPAILTVSLAAAAVLRSLGLKPDFVAGHSLGEYSALVEAGGLSLTAGAKLVRARGLVMSRAATPGLGGMAALLGLPVEKVEELCAASGVELANINSPGQVVIAGRTEQLAVALERAREMGAKRAIPLAVSGPFHSSLMQAAAEEFGAVLDEAGLADLRTPLVANVDARPHRAAAEMLSLLKRQIAAPVRWEEGMRFLAGAGVETMFEAGPKNVLAGLMKRIAPGVRVLTTDRTEEIRRIETELKARS